MGLDMHLSAKRYLWSFPEDGPDVVTGKAIAELLGVGKTRVKQIEADVIYWRKANAIHKWFVDNVQDGADDCRQYNVTRGQLQELLDLITQVIDSKDASNLPPTSGFFFGSNEVDNWYWQDLVNTNDQLTALLTNSNFEQWDFFYQSSW
jgi:hypothetical protein